MCEIQCSQICLSNPIMTYRSMVQYKEPCQRFVSAAPHCRDLMPAGHQNVDTVIRKECSAKQLALSANEPTCGGWELRVYEKAVSALNNKIIPVITIFNMRHNIICGTNYKYRTAATPNFIHQLMHFYIQGVSRL